MSRLSDDINAMVDKHEGITDPPRNPYKPAIDVRLEEMSSEELLCAEMEGLCYPLDDAEWLKRHNLLRGELLRRLDLHAAQGERIAELERLNKVAENAFKLQDAVSIPGRTGELNCLQIAKAWLALEKKTEAAESEASALREALERIVHADYHSLDDNVRLLNCLHDVTGIARAALQAKKAVSNGE